ncbi:hypothetical protein NLG97_g8892 [Lecanicillium saksenae]|uniref:Uncharacterized protein n=1 Tax=Lecanicillium saksenae TaxID=468837 RepID=A0ACC1QHL2_9HYPO|nr:hypothetical protein NLG97_g8892 [Lecanicillium saksenae]
MPTDAMPQGHDLARRSTSSEDISVTSQRAAFPLMHHDLQQHLPSSSRRARRANLNLQLPPHFRRRIPMENDSWIQSISDIEDESRLGRNFLHGMPRIDQMPQPHPSFSGHTIAAQESGSPSMPGGNYNSTQFLTTSGPPTTYSSPIWPCEPHQLGFDGVSSTPMSAIWPQSNCPPYLPDTSVSLPSTPAPAGIFQSSFHDPQNHQMPHLNTPPRSAVSLSKMSSNGSERKPQLKLNTGSHGYFKENGSVIMNKWFNTSSTQIAPPQLYNVPPPASLASQDSFNDASSVASGQKLRLTPVGLRPARSDLSSSRLSVTSAGDYASQSPQTDASIRKRLPSHASVSPMGQRDSEAEGSSRYNSPSCATSVAPSAYESDSNYAGSSIQSSQPSRQPSRQVSRQPSSLPSPALSEDRKSAQNAFLINARAKGMSYKEIKLKGGFTEAESTLRGRHRMLTKDKDSRVRKPEWTDTDVSSTKPKLPRIILKTHST